MAIASPPLPDRPRDGAYDAVLRWLIFAALVCLGAGVLWDYGFFSYVVEADTSRISPLIAALFLGYSFYCLTLLVRLGRERRAALAVARALDKPGGTISPDLAAGGPMVAGYLRDVMLKHDRDPGAGRQVLTQAFAASLRAPARTGLYAADLLYKLGMLGTVIGFVFMLGSMDELQAVDPDSLRNALQQMTGGMAIALLTTIAGLVCGILLRIEFNIADALAADVLRIAVRISEVGLGPALAAVGGDV